MKIEKTISIIDPDAGMMHRPGKPEGMHYLSHQSIEAANGMIVDVAVTPRRCERFGTISGTYRLYAQSFGVGYSHSGGR